MRNDSPSLEFVSACVLGVMGNETDPNWMFTQWKIKKVQPRLSGCISCLSGWSRPLLKVWELHGSIRTWRAALTASQRPLSTCHISDNLRTRENQVEGGLCEATPPLHLCQSASDCSDIELTRPPSGYSHFTTRNIHQSGSNAHAISSANINTTKNNTRSYSPLFIFTKQRRR